MNKKGSTLLELVISIALISVILVFLMRLLVDLNNTEANNTYAKKNQVNRAEILRAIQNDLNKNTITSIDGSSSTADTLKIKFYFLDKESLIEATEDKFTYTSSDGNTRTWTMNGAKIYPKLAKLDYSNDNLDDDDSIYTLQIDIEVHTENENNTLNNNNILDDIIISYMGKSKDYFTYTPCLGYECNEPR